MKLRLIVASSVLVALVGCCAPNAEFFGSLERSWEKIRPYAEAGVKCDTTLDSDQKAVRLQLIQEFDETLKEGADAE